MWSEWIFDIFCGNGCLYLLPFFSKSFSLWPRPIYGNTNVVVDEKRWSNWGETWCAFSYHLYLVDCWVQIIIKPNTFYVTNIPCHMPRGLNALSFFVNYLSPSFVKLTWDFATWIKTTKEKIHKRLHSSYVDTDTLTWQSCEPPTTISLCVRWKNINKIRFLSLPHFVHSGTRLQGLFSLDRIEVTTIIHFVLAVLGKPVIFLANRSYWIACWSSYSSAFPIDPSCDEGEKVIK